LNAVVRRTLINQPKPSPDRRADPALRRSGDRSPRRSIDPTGLLAVQRVAGNAATARLIGRRAVIQREVKQIASGKWYSTHDLPPRFFASREEAEARDRELASTLASRADVPSRRPVPPEPASPRGTPPAVVPPPRPPRPARPEPGQTRAVLTPPPRPARPEPASPRATSPAVAPPSRLNEPERTLPPLRTAAPSRPLPTPGRAPGVLSVPTAPARSDRPSSPSQVRALSAENQREMASLATVDLDRLRAAWRPPGKEDPSDMDALYEAFAWSEAKHGGRGPDVGPAARDEDFTIFGSVMGVQYRVYLNTTGRDTPTVSEWLSSKNISHKRGPPGWAADRRDAIVIYVRMQGPSLQNVLDELATYQADQRKLAFFEAERVRLTRPGVGRSGGGAVTLRGVGIADEPSDISTSFSQLATAAALRARQATGTGTAAAFQAHLAEELERAGRAPGDPSRERYEISVDGRSVTLPERETTGAAIMSAAGIDSTRYDLVDAWQRVTADQRIFILRGKSFTLVPKGGEIVMSAPLPRVGADAAAK
jgi:hypothetical protein